MTNELHVDLLAIGGGSGGLAVAQRAALHGRRAALAERADLGGTCVNLGCVPKKLLWHAAQIAQCAHDAAGHGFEPLAPVLDWAALRHRRDAFIGRLHGVYARNLDTRGVTHLRGHASFETPGVVRVGDTRVHAAHVVIATGGRPLRPPLPGAELGLTSDDLFALDALPPRMAVVGGGYIAVELASLLAAFGVQVQLVFRHQRVLRHFDEMIGTALSRELAAAGVQMVGGFTPVALERQQGALVLHGEGARVATPVDALVWAVGRAPMTEGLGLAHAGVQVDAQGFVPTDAWQDTNVPGIHAIGDVTGRAALTPVAIAAGRRLADRLFGGQPKRRLDYENVPTVVFSHPPVGTVGLSEAEARTRHALVEVRQASFVPMSSALAPRRRRTDMKLVLAGERRQVVGLHVVGEGADEMLQGFAVAVRMGATLEDFHDTVAIHPTSAEELVTMK